MSYTKGKWIFKTVETSCGICHKIGPFPKRGDNDGYACVYVDNNAWHNSDELLANARLMAAAPDLLEALEILYHEWDQTYDGEPMSIELVAGYKLAKAAIAKARGEA